MILQYSNGYKSRRFDVVIACCGYESRSRAMIESVKFRAKLKIAVGYGEREVLAFRDNRKVFRSEGFVILRLTDDEFLGRIRSVLSGAVHQGPLRVLLDISCFTRLRLALLLQAIVEIPHVQLEVFYSLATFSKAGTTEPRNEHLCPVSSFFAGWNGESDKAVALISGLGYEQLRALGIMEHIDPFESWLFFPDSPIPAYDVEVAKANSLLLSNVSKSNVLHYPVMGGAETLQKLLSLTRALRSRYRCVVMPLGPKIFAFSALIVGCVFSDVSVWRASAGRYSEPRNRKPSEFSTRFAVEFDQDSQSTS